MLWIRSA